MTPQTVEAAHTFATGCRVGHPSGVLGCGGHSDLKHDRRVGILGGRSLRGLLGV
jgi:hypothetical protein